MLETEGISCKARNCSPRSWTAERAQCVTSINTVPLLGLGGERERLSEAGVPGAAGGGCSWTAPEPGAPCRVLRPQSWRTHEQKEYSVTRAQRSGAPAASTQSSEETRTRRAGVESQVQSKAGFLIAQG